MATAKAFSIAEAEQAYEKYAAEFPVQAGTEEARRASYLTPALIRALGGSTEQLEWILSLGVAAELAEFSAGFQAGFRAGRGKG